MDPHEREANAACLASLQEPVLGDWVSFRDAGGAIRQGRVEEYGHARDTIWVRVAGQRVLVASGELVRV